VICLEKGNKLGSFELLAASNRIMVQQKYLLGEISACLPLFSFSKKAFKGYEKIKSCYIISKY